MNCELLYKHQAHAAFLAGIGACDQGFQHAYLPRSNSAAYLPRSNSAAEQPAMLHLQSLADSSIQLSCFFDSVIWSAGLKTQTQTLQHTKGLQL